jgi:UPF0271 protein
MQQEIDINCDLGESYGIYRYGADRELFPLASSVNVACGFHAGDPRVMRETIEAAASRDVRIGAHIGLPDRLGFGRRMMQVSPEDVYDYCLYQIGALDGFLRAYKVPMTHIKLHGALYMMAAEQPALADATVKAVARYNPQLEVYAMRGSELALSAIRAGLSVAHEIFADRPYDGSVVKMFGWTMEEVGEPQDIANRVLHMLGHDNQHADSIHVDTVCVHSDTPGAPAIVSHVRSCLENAGWTIGRTHAALTASDDNFCRA